MEQQFAPLIEKSCGGVRQHPPQMSDPIMGLLNLLKRILGRSQQQKFDKSVLLKRKWGGFVFGVFKERATPTEADFKDLLKQAALDLTESHATDYLTFDSAKQLMKSNDQIKAAKLYIVWQALNLAMHA